MDLLQIGRVTFNNLDAEEEEDGQKQKPKEEKPDEFKEAKFLAMMAKFTDAMSSSASANGKSESGGGGKKREFQQWRYENPNNDKTKLVRGTTMKWCKNDCHDKPMWCGCKTFINKAKYAKKMQEERHKAKGSSDSSSGSGDMKVSEDFKIALQAMTLSDDFKMLEKQFLSGN